MVEKFCSRSHGQPVLGVRSAAMMSSSRAISRAGVKAVSDVLDVLAKVMAGFRENAGTLPDLCHSIPGFLRVAARLEQEPGEPLGLVDEILQESRGRDVAVLVGKLMTFAHRGRDGFVVVHQLA